MPVFKVDVEKFYLGRYWTNRWFVLADTLAQAHTSAPFFVAGETGCHITGINITKVRTSTFAPNDGLFLTTLYSAPGTLPINGNGLPLFNVVRVDFAAGEGRPSRKFFRSGLGTGNVAPNYMWDAVPLNSIEASLGTMRTNLSGNSTPLIDDDQQVLGDPFPQPLIGMRQLRRGTRRATEPVLP